MSGTKISVNGRLLATGAIPDICQMMQGCYVYAAVNTDAHRPLYLDRHMAYAVSSYEKLYDTRPEYDLLQLNDNITELLDAERMPRLGNIVFIYLLPPADPKRPADIVAATGHSTIYKGYELASLRPKAILTNYELPFSGHRTAVSLAASNYMQDFAERSGCHIALHCNRAERLVSCGDYPVFIAMNGTLYTPPSILMPPCTERELMARACDMAGITIEECDITTDMLPDAEEIMVFDHTGLRSVLSLGNCFYYNLLAKRLEAAMPVLNADGLL